MTDPAKARILGIIGAAGSGKTAVANILLANHYRLKHTSFATPLRHMIRALLKETMPATWPISPADYMNDPVRKNEPIPYLGNMRARHLLQTLGTEWGRNTLHPDFWVFVTASKIERLLASTFMRSYDGLSVVIDDVRFPNEVEMVRALGGTILRVDRPVNPNAIPGAHASEQHHLTIEPDLTFINDGDLEALGKQALAIWPAREKPKLGGPGRGHKKKPPADDTDHL